MKKVETFKNGKPKVGSKITSVSLTNKETEYLKSIGAGSVTLGIRQLVKVLTQNKEVKNGKN